MDAAKLQRLPRCEFGEDDRRPCPVIADLALSLTARCGRHRTLERWSIGDDLDSRTVDVPLCVALVTADEIDPSHPYSEGFGSVKKHVERFTMMPVSLGSTTLR